MMTDEQDEKITVNFDIYRRFFTTYYGWLWVFCTNLAMGTNSSVTVLSDYIIGYWANDPNQYEDFWKYAPIVIGMTFVMGICFALRACANQGYTRIAAKRLHRAMINRVLNAPVNTYFDVTPVGRIMNKFSKDLN